MSCGCQSAHPHGACETEYQYAIKVVCGELKVPPQSGALQSMQVAPGLYWTAINIHNPAKCGSARFRWKVVEALDLKVGEISKYQREIGLGPDLGIEIDTGSILKSFSPPKKFMKGYVVIESDSELDIVAVYTSGQSQANPLLNSFHTERVKPRIVPVCEDLLLPISTGFADWRIDGPAAEPVVRLTGLHPNWATPSFGSAWVSQLATDSNNAPDGTTRSYKLCFDLCFGFQALPFDIQVLADNNAQVFLNSHLIGNVTSFGVPTVLNVNAAALAALKAGENCFRVRVANGVGQPGNPTGFALSGLMRVLKGKCPCSQQVVQSQSAPPISID